MAFPAPVPLDAKPGTAEPLAGCLLGLALGDALGFVVEAEPPEAARAYARGVLRAGRAAERGHPGFPFGQYSDDTQLARELLLSLVDAGGWDPGRFGLRVAALFLAGREVGAGPGTRAAAWRLLLGAPWSRAGTPAPYAGNGSAMRVAPLGVLFRDDEPGLTRYAVEQSRVTHHDARCAAGAVAVAGAAALASCPGPIDPAALLARLAARVELEDRAMAMAVRGVAGWLGLEPAAAARRLHQDGLDPAHAGTWRGVSAFVIPSVAWSLYAFLRTPDDWWESVCTAIEVGGDTDTMAAMTGAIAGARLGTAALPAPLLERLTDRGRWDAAELARLAERCIATVPTALDRKAAGVVLAEPVPS